MKSILSFIILLCSFSASAGYVEVGTTGSYYKSTIDDYNYEEKKDVSLSISYYFWAQSALELSATSRLNVTKVGTSDVNSQVTIQTESLMYGLDFVLSLADMKADFRPYVKVGGLYIHKRVVQTTAAFPYEVIPFEDGIAPSAGVGLKLKLTELLSLKIGAEAWSLPLGNNKAQYDYAGRAGLSWVF